MLGVVPNPRGDCCWPVVVAAAVVFCVDVLFGPNSAASQSPGVSKWVVWYICIVCAIAYELRVGWWWCSSLFALHCAVVDASLLLLSARFGGDLSS